MIVSWASVAGAALAARRAAADRVQAARPRRDSRSITPTRRCGGYCAASLPVFASRGVVQISAFIDIAAREPHRGRRRRRADLQRADDLPAADQPVRHVGVRGRAAGDVARLRRDGGGERAAADAPLDGAARASRSSSSPPPSASSCSATRSSSLLLEGGRFTREDTVRTWAILGGYARGPRRQLARPALLVDVLRAARHAHAAPVRARAHRRHRAARLRAARFRVPRALGLPAWTGAVGLTAASGIAGWLEFALLRRAIGRRIGSVASVAAPRRSCCGWRGLVAATAGWGVTRLPIAAPRAVHGALAIAAFAAGVRRRHPRARRPAGPRDRGAGAAPLANARLRAAGII